MSAPTSLSKNQINSFDFPVQLCWVRERFLDPLHRLWTWRTSALARAPALPCWRTRRASPACHLHADCLPTARLCTPRAGGGHGAPHLNATWMPTARSCTPCAGGGQSGFLTKLQPLRAKAIWGTRQTRTRLAVLGLFGGPDPPSPATYHTT